MADSLSEENGTLHKGLIFNFFAASGCNKLWEITSPGQVLRGLKSCQRLKLRGKWQTLHEFDEKSLRSSFRVR